MSYKEHELNNKKSIKYPKAPPLDAVAESAIRSKIKIIPVGHDKVPLIHDWQKPGSGSYLRSVLMEWRRKLKNPAWGLPCGPESGGFAVDIDFQKNKNKKPIGPPILEIIKQEWLDKASFSQNTQSTFKEKKTCQYIFKWEDRLKIFKNKRVPGTTIDFRTKGGQIVLYRPLPPSEIWNELNTMPDALFNALCSLLKTKQASEDWKPGNRNNTLFKKLINDLEKNRGRNIPDILNKADQSGLPKGEIKTTSASAVKTAIGNGIEPPPETANGALNLPDKKIIPKTSTKEALQVFKISSKPREWFMNEKIYIRGRENQTTADPGAGKSTFARETAYRYWKIGGTVILFAEEDSPSEDISPFLQSKPEFKDGDEVPRFYVFTDWHTHPVFETLQRLKHIPDKFVVVDPTHHLFADVSKPAQCRTILMDIRNQAKNPTDTIVYINHPKSFWKEHKLSGSELNAGTKELGRICRGSTVIKVNADTGINTIEHTKRQLNAERYSFNLVEDFIKNKKGEVCTYSKIEDFKVIKKQASPGETVLPPGKSLSAKRKKIRDGITGTFQVYPEEWTPRQAIETELKQLKIKGWELDRELSEMANEGLLERDFKDRKAVYSLKMFKKSSKGGS